MENTATDEYQARVIGWLGGAVRIPYVYPLIHDTRLNSDRSFRTESYDYMGPVDEDPRWQVWAVLRLPTVNFHPRVRVLTRLNQLFNQFIAIPPCR